jgi:hypothetical protein
MEWSLYPDNQTRVFHSPGKPGTREFPVDQSLSPIDFLSAFIQLHEKLF